MNAKKVVGLIAISIPILFFSACSYISHKGNNAFDATLMGDSSASVVRKFGLPYVMQTRGNGFPRYTADMCEGQCAKRLWFENKVSFDIEAWSVDLDEKGHVVAKYHWVSP